MFAPERRKVVILAVDYIDFAFVIVVVCVLADFF